MMKMENKKKGKVEFAFFVVSSSFIFHPMLIKVFLLFIPIILILFSLKKKKNLLRDMQANAACKGTLRRLLSCNYRRSCWGLGLEGCHIKRKQKGYEREVFDSRNLGWIKERKSYRGKEAEKSQKERGKIEEDCQNDLRGEERVTEKALGND